MLAFMLLIATMSRDTADYERFAKLSVPDRVAAIHADRRLDKLSLPFLARVMITDPVPGVRSSASIRLKWRSSASRDEAVLLHLPKVLRPDLEELVASSLYQPKSIEATAALSRIIASAKKRNDESVMRTTAASILSAGREEDWKLVSSHRLSPHVFEWAWRTSGSRNITHLVEKYRPKNTEKSFPPTPGTGQ